MELGAVRDEIAKREQLVSSSADELETARAAEA
jgi:hypothetical protein